MCRGCAIGPSLKYFGIPHIHVGDEMGPALGAPPWARQRGADVGGGEIPRSLEASISGRRVSAALAEADSRLLNSSVCSAVTGTFVLASCWDLEVKQVSCGGATGQPALPPQAHSSQPGEEASGDPWMLRTCLH